MAMVKFPRIKPEPKVEELRKKLMPCINCGKGLGSCRGGWCQRCVDTWMDQTTPKVEDQRQPNEMLGRPAFKGNHSRRLSNDKVEE